MAKRKDEITSMAGFVFKCIWLGVALLMFFVGMVYFFGHLNDGFMSWLFWGFCCMFPMIGQVIKNAIDSAKKGAREGANHYTVTSTSTGVTVSNHPFREALIGFIVAIAASLLLGPVYLGLNIILVIIQIINYILALKIAKKSQQNNTQNDAQN